MALLPMKLMGLPPGSSTTPPGNTLTRTKTEVVYSGLTGVTIPTTTTNLVTLLKALTPTSGTLGAPFFNTTSNRFFALPFGSVCNFKINFVGTWNLSLADRSMELSFPGSTGNNLVVVRNATTTVDIVSFVTFFSIDATGVLATTGSAATVKSNGATYSVTDIVVVCDQLTWT